MDKKFHIKIQVKKTNINTLFDSYPDDNLIEMILVSNILLEVHDHPRPYPLAWVNTHAHIKVHNSVRLIFL